MALQTRAVPDSAHSLVVPAQQRKNQARGRDFAAPYISGVHGLEKYTKCFPLSCGLVSTIVVPGDKHAVLLLHGNSSCKEVWTHQIECLAQRGHAVIAPDLPGHGHSEDAVAAKKTYSFPGYAAVIRELLDALHLSSVDLVGWSLGGHIGLELYADDPRIHALLIVGTPPARPSAAALDQAFWPSEGMKLAGKRDFSDGDALAYASAMMGGGKFVTPHILSAAKRTHGLARHFMFENALAGVGSDQRRAAETVNKPLCVVHGALEPYVRLDYLQSINYRALWLEHIHVIAGAGHAPHWSSPIEFNDVMTSLLEGETRSTALSQGTFSSCA